MDDTGRQFSLRETRHPDPAGERGGEASLTLISRIYRAAHDDYGAAASAPPAGSACSQHVVTSLTHAPPVITALYQRQGL